MTDVLEIDGVILEFGSTRILQDVYLRCETGKVVGVLGRNGTGKSSLFKIIFGELTATSQSVRINGKAYTTDKRPQKDVMFLPQFGFVPHHLSLGRLLEDFELNFNELVEYFPEFGQRLKDKLADLSSGQRRIVEIYSILMSPAKFCILDEPFSGVMPVHVDQFKQLVLRQATNKGIIISDHLYRHILDLSDYIYVIKEGKTHLVKDREDLARLGYTKVRQ